VPLQVVAEALFTDEMSSAIRFDDFAAADVDNDGRVTGVELTNAKICRSGCGTVREQFGGLFDSVRTRGGRLFVER